jgi:hypothetical protein
MRRLKADASALLSLNFFKYTGAHNLSFSVAFIFYIYSIYIRCEAFNYSFIYWLEDITFALYTEG